MAFLTLIQFSKINLSAKTAAIQRLSAEQGEVYHLPYTVSSESGLFHLLFFVVGACTIENAKIELKRLSISTHDLNELIPIATRQNIRSLMPCRHGLVLP